MITRKRHTPFTVLITLLLAVLLIGAGGAWAEEMLFLCGTETVILNEQLVTRAALGESVVNIVEVKHSIDGTGNLYHAVIPDPEQATRLKTRKEFLLSADTSDQLWYKFATLFPELNNKLATVTLSDDSVQTIEAFKASGTKETPKAESGIPHKWMTDAYIQSLKDQTAIKVEEGKLIEAGKAVTK